MYFAINSRRDLSNLFLKYLIKILEIYSPLTDCSKFYKKPKYTPEVNNYAKHPYYQLISLKITFNIPQFSILFTTVYAIFSTKS